MKLRSAPASKNLEIKDLTGAGDLFAGGFLDGYIKGTLKESLENNIVKSYTNYRSKN